jgi:hypothetical protein
LTNQPPLSLFSSEKGLLQFRATMPRARSIKSSNNNSANIGFEQKLWLAADELRSNMDAAEYKHVVLGLIFLKYISDSFEEHHGKLIAGEGEYAGANPEDPDEYRAETSSGFRPPRVGAISRIAPSNRRSARSSTTPWSPSSATTSA